MKRIVIFIFSILFIWYWVNNIRKEFISDKFIDNLDKYKQAKEILLINKDTIKTNLNYKEYDSIQQVDRPTIFLANEFYFDNTIIKSNPTVPELRKLKTLWDTGLLEESGGINFDNDNTITFNVKTFTGGLLSSTIKHKIVYDPNHTYLDHNSEKIDKHKILDKNWVYVIEGEYWE